MRKVILVVAFLLLFSCSNEANRQGDLIEDELEVFTAESLAAYNGIDGAKAYVAIDGLVYDVTGLGLWPEGQHRGQYQAGQDLSDIIRRSPHGLSKLDDLEVVGRYIEE